LPLLLGPAVKAAKGKLTLSVDVAIRLQRAEQAPGIRFRALDRPVLLLSTRLPDAGHNDPADRNADRNRSTGQPPARDGRQAHHRVCRGSPATPVIDPRSVMAGRVHDSTPLHGQFLLVQLETADEAVPGRIGAAAVGVNDLRI
jgi:hypothetical protein